MFKRRLAPAGVIASVAAGTAERENFPSSLSGVSDRKIKKGKCCLLEDCWNGSRITLNNRTPN
jgi:hypothetical protein